MRAKTYSTGEWVPLTSFWTPYIIPAEMPAAVPKAPKIFSFFFSASLKNVDFGGKSSCDEPDAEFWCDDPEGDSGAESWYDTSDGGSSPHSGSAFSGESSYSSSSGHSSSSSSSLNNSHVISPSDDELWCDELDSSGGSGELRDEPDEDK